MTQFQLETAVRLADLGWEPPPTLSDDPPQNQPFGGEIEITPPGAPKDIWIVAPDGSVRPKHFSFET